LAERDSIVTSREVERLAAALPNARLVRLPLGHFDVYCGEAFEKVVALEVDFLREHLMKQEGRSNKGN
jgi:hypothetical protein